MKDEPELANKIKVLTDAGVLRVQLEIEYETKEDMMKRFPLKHHSGCDPMDNFSARMMKERSPSEERTTRKVANRSKDWARSRLYKFLRDSMSQREIEEKKLELIYLNPREIDILDYNESSYLADIIRKRVEETNL